MGDRCEPGTARTLSGVRALFTDREGGVSRGAFARLNLARHVGDDDGAVTENRRRTAERIGAPLVFVEQVHSARVHTVAVDAPLAVELTGAVRTADAIVTARRDVALAIMVADCLPVLLTDPAAGVIGAAHAGRRGLLDGVLQATLGAMAELGARPERVLAEIGPSICGRCYEVPPEMLEESARILPSARSITRAGTPALDLRAGARSVLEGEGLRAASIADQPPCTLEDPRHFSYRRDRVTGRFAGIIRRV